MGTDLWQTIGIFLAILTSVVSIWISFYQTRKSNNIAKESNRIANESNRIATEAQKDANRPILRLNSIYFDPRNAKVFGGPNISWDAKKDFVGNQLFEIQKTNRSDSIVNFNYDDSRNKKEYLLINLANRNTLSDDIGLILNALSFDLENVGAPINELTIKEAYSMLSSDTPFPMDMRIADTTFLIIGNTISINIAYACEVSQQSSLNLPSIAKKIASGDNEVIDLVKHPERAGEIICFVETGYMFTCKTADNQVYDFSLFINRETESDGRLKYHHIYYGREVFDRRSLDASKRADKNVVVKKA